MKILTLTNLYPPHDLGGDELRCAAIVQALQARGHEVAVLTSNHGLPPGAFTIVDPGVERSLRIHGFFGRPWLGIRLLRELEFHNNRRLQEAIRQFHPDAVHVWNLGGLSKSLALTLQQLNIPTVYDVSNPGFARDLAEDGALRWWNRTDPSLTHRLLRASWTVSGARRHWQAKAPTNPVSDLEFRRLYFGSRALRDLTEAQGYAVGHGAIIPSPVDTERFHGVPRTLEQPLRNLLYVGPLTEDGGALTALKALALLKGYFGGVLHLYERGETSGETALRSFAERADLRVEFRCAEASEMPEVYRQHHALLFTSEREETSPTPLEAMASGLPVIGAATGGSSELFRHRENALVYQSGNAAALAAQILTLDRDIDLRATLAATGQRETRENFHPARIVSQIEEYLVETIGGWPSHPRSHRTAAPDARKCAPATAAHSARRHLQVMIAAQTDAVPRGRAGNLVSCDSLAKNPLLR